MGHQVRGSSKSAAIMHYLMSKVHFEKLTESEARKLEAKLRKMNATQVDEYIKTHKVKR